MFKILTKFSLQPSWMILLIGIIWLLIVAFIDYVIVANISLSIFYSLSIFLGTWCLGKSAGLAFSLLSSLAWFVSEINAQENEPLFILEWNTLVRLLFFLIITHLLTEIKQSYEREKCLARTDRLTGLWNRLYFLELLDLEIKRFQRKSQPFTLAYLDIDNFKKVNDTWGHNRGDKLLILTAQVLQQNVRQVDAIARLGGDEFVLLLPETDLKNGNLVLQRVNKKLREMIEIESFPVGFSIGAVTFYSLPESIDEILAIADRWMYEVKKNGKNRLNHHAYRIENHPS